MHFYEQTTLVMHISNALGRFRPSQKCTWILLLLQSKTQIRHIRSKSKIVQCIVFRVDCAGVEFGNIWWPGQSGPLTSGGVMAHFWWNAEMLRCAGILLCLREVFAKFNDRFGSDVFAENLREDRHEFSMHLLSCNCPFKWLWFNGMCM